MSGSPHRPPAIGAKIVRRVDAHNVIAYRSDGKLFSPALRSNLVRVVLSPYAFVIGFVFVVLTAAATAYAVMRTGGVMRRSRSYDSLKLPSELPMILGEFQESIEGVQDESRRAAKVGGAIVSALGPIELALQDFKKRITKLEKRADENAKQLAELNSSLVERQTALEGNTRAIERSTARLEGIDQQSIAVADQLSSLKQMTESSISRHEESREELRAIKSGFAAVQAELTGLSQRVAFGETGQTQLSALAEALARSLAAIEAGSKEAAQRIVAMEPRVLWRLDELETLFKSALAAVDRGSANGAEHGRTAGTEANNEK
jgi:chromosome segregation ATPase